MTSAAQDRVRIDLEKHFEGLVEAFDSEYSKLYRFEEFMGVEGRTVDAAELAEWQAKWTAEVARAEAAKEELLADPPRHVDFKLRKRLERHHYFRDRFRDEEFRPDFRFPPFVLYIQQPKGEDTGTSEEDVQRYGEWFQTLERAFRQQFAEPLGLEMRSTLPGYALFILRGREEYNLYGKELDGGGLYWARAHYDPAYRIGVTYQDTKGAAQDSDEIHSAMHEMVHAFQHAYHVDAGEETSTGLSTPPWFNEGFAEFLAYRTRMIADGKSNTVPAKSTGEINALVTRWKDAGARCVLPLITLAQVENYGQAASLFSTTLSRAGHTIGDPMQLLGLLYRQSDLWMHFLYDGADGRYRELMMAYTQAVLTDVDDTEAFARSFAAAEPGELDRAFIEFLAENRVHRGALTALRDTRPDPADLPRIAAVEGAGKIRVPEATAGPGEASGVTAGGAVDPSATLVLDDDLRMSGAIELLRAGRWQAGADALATLDGELATRMRARATELVAMRTDFFRHMVEKGSRMTLQVDGTRLLARVTDVTGDEVVFEENKTGIERLKLEEVDPISMCDYLRGSRSGFDAPPIVALPYLLAGESSWEYMLDDSEAADGLRADADEIARLAQDAGAAAGLALVAGLAHPTDRAQAEAALGHLAALMADHRHDPRVTARIAGLRAVAARAAAHTFVETDDGGAAPALAVASETLADGRLQVTYGFESVDELADFAVTGDAPAIDGGSLVLTGTTKLTSRVAFDAPIAVRVKVRVPVDPDPANDPRVALGLSGAGGRGAQVKSTGEAIATDGDGERVDAGDEWPRNRLFEVELVHDGGNINTRIEGMTTSRAKAGQVTGGAPSIEARSRRPVYVAELVVTGHLGVATGEHAREAHVERVLAELGL